MSAYLALTPYGSRPAPSNGQLALRVLEGPGTWLLATEHDDAPTDRPCSRCRSSRGHSAA